MDLANGGQTIQAKAHLTAALRLLPQAAEAHNNLGVLLAQEGEMQNAMDHFSTAIRLKPEYLKPHLNLAAAYAKRGQFKEAIATGHQALHRLPSQAKMSWLSKFRAVSNFIPKARRAIELTEVPVSSQEYFVQL